jgi:hypothetical protein
MLKLLLILISVFFIAGCRGGGGSGAGSLFASILGSAGASGSFVSGNSASGSSSSFASDISGSLGSGSGSFSGAGAQTFHSPEPSTLALLSIGLAGLAAVALRKKKK